MKKKLHKITNKNKEEILSLMNQHKPIESKSNFGDKYNMVIECYKIVLKKIRSNYPEKEVFIKLSIIYIH